MRQYVGRTACTVLSIAAAAFVAAGCGGSSDSGASSGGGVGGAAGGIQVKPDDAKYAAYQNGSLDQKLHTELPCNTSPSPEEQVAYQVPKAKLVAKGFSLL